MRLPLFDSIYILSSLWTAPAGSPVCASSSSSMPGTMHEAALSSTPRISADVTAFVDVNVVPMDTERVLTNQTVLVQDGRIIALGPMGRVPVPSGALRIDGRGKYLIPGFTDMHYHDYSAEFARADEHASGLFAQLASGVTAIRNLNAVSKDDARKFRSFKMVEEKLSPHVYMAGELWEFAKPGLGLDSTAAAYKAAGYEFIVAPNPDSILAAARRLGLPPAAHFHGGSLEYLQALGVYGGSMEHLYSFMSYEFLDSLQQGQANRSESELRSLAAAARRTGLWVTPTLDCLVTEWANRGPRYVALTRQLVKAMQDAGVGLLLGIEGGAAHKELTALVRAGLTPYQALLTGTRNVAEYFGTLDESGTVAIEKQADLVLLYGNPLADIRHTREPAGVMRGGRWFDRAELDQRLLASPKAWLMSTVVQSGVKPFLTTEEQHHKLNACLQQLEALADSLEQAKPLEQRGRLSYKRTLRLVTNELGVMRTILPAEHRETFDPMARTWMREQARQGYRMVVPGVPLKP